MSAPMTLRRRVTLGTTLLGFVLSALFATAVVLVTEDYEHVLASEILRGQAEDYGLRLANGLAATLPRTQRLSGYRAGESGGLPRAYSALPPGVHGDALGNGVHVGVFDTSAGRLVFVIDLSDIEALEQRLDLFLAGMVVLGTLVAGWLGWSFSGAALQPLRRLAEGVEQLPVEPRPTRLAANVSRDDLGRLAMAIDAYQARLVESDAREQAFFADASHELRTPLAVIQGVTEVLLDDPPGDAGDVLRLRRLERGVRDMRQLLEAMLAAARRQPLQVEPTDMATLLAETAAMALAGKPGITCTVGGTGRRALARREATLLLAGLVRALVRARTAGELALRAEPDRLLLLLSPEPGEPRPDQASQLRADTGTGSALLDRLAVRLGWRVVFDTPERVCVLFGEAQEPSVAAGRG